MDWLTFISNVIKSLAWPCTAAFVFYYAVHNGNKISTFIKSFKYKDLEIVLRDQLSEAKELSDEIRIASNSPAALSRPETDESLITKLAAIDPPVAMLKIWQGLESKIIGCIQYNGLMRYTNPARFMQQLVKRHANGTPDRRAKRTPRLGFEGLVQVANRRAPRARVARFNGAGGAGAWEVPVCPPVAVTINFGPLVLTNIGPPPEV